MTTNLARIAKRAKSLKPKSEEQAVANVTRRQLVQSLRNKHFEFNRLASAVTSRVLADWTTNPTDADLATLQDLPIARERARDAALNDPIAVALRRAMADFVVGRGIFPKSNVSAARLGIDESQAAEWNAAVDDLITRNQDKADITGRCGWGRLQRLTYLSIFDGGDVFPSYPMPPHQQPEEVRTRINLIEAERVADGMGGRMLGVHPNPNIKGGVEVDKWGRPIAYHVLRGHPGERRHHTKDPHKLERWLRVKAGRINVVHLYNQDRVGGSRGIPFLAPALPIIDQAANYVDDVILQARLQNALSVWIYTQGDPVAMEASMSDNTKNDRYRQWAETGVQSGSINVLGIGDRAEMLDTKTPGAFFDSLLVRLLRTVCATLGMSYEMVFDVGGANYSSIRMGANRLRRTIECEREMLIPGFKVWREHAIHEAWLDGLLPNVRFEDDQEAWTTCDWEAPPLPAIDPKVENEADAQAIETGIKSPSQCIRERGGDPKAVIEERNADAAQLQLPFAQPETPVPAPAPEEVSP